MINLLGLTVGLSAAIVLFVALRYEWSFDDAHSDADRIFRVVQHNHTEGSTQYWNTTAYPLAAALRNDFPAIEVTQTAGPYSGIISTEDRMGHEIRFREDKILFVDPHYLEIFDFAQSFGNPEAIWLQGNPETAFAADNGVILTQKLADRYFAEAVAQGESVLGRTLLLDNNDPLTVSGVVRNPPPNTSLLFDLLIPYAFFEKSDPYRAGNWSGNYQGTTFVKFQEAPNVPQWEKQMALWQKKYHSPEDNARIEYRLQAVTDMHTESLYGNTPGSYVSSSKLLWVLAGMGGILLLIAVFNFINLATALIAQRSREVGVRKVLGGTKAQLRLQFLSETFMLTLLAGVLSMTFSGFLLGLLNGWMEIVDLHLALSAEAWFFAGGLVVLTALLAGLYPAIVMSRFSPAKALKKQAEERQAKGLNLRRVLIVSQFAIVQLLVVCTIVIAQQMKYVASKDLGFKQEAIVDIHIPVKDSMLLNRLWQRLDALPGIQKMSYASGPPTTRDLAYGTLFRLQEEPEIKGRSTEMKVVDLNYLDLYGLEMIAGNWLGQAQVSNRFNGFVVNETAVAKLGLEPEEAIGKRIAINEGEAPIIGVMKDFHNNSLQEDISPCIFLYWGNFFFDELYVQLQPVAGSIPATLAAIENTWQEVFPKHIYTYQFLDESLARNYAVEHTIFQAFQAVAILAVFVGCIGLFGLISFLNEKRNKEIGIRKILGATVAQVAGLLSKEILLLICIGLLLASPVAWYAMQKWLEGFAYQIRLQGWMFLLAGMMGLCIAALTIGAKIWAAARTNPVESLRSE